MVIHFNLFGYKLNIDGYTIYIYNIQIMIIW